MTCLSAKYSGLVCCDCGKSISKGKRCNACVGTQRRFNKSSKGAAAHKPRTLVGCANGDDNLYIRRTIHLTVEVLQPKKGRKKRL